ncbi:Nif3-like dinuclear metal center hexameric protein [Undibacterium squillarum]|uniref:GTP cyclohydrolase 1 type 2 n=1 Tax=Undibacterium squillarum TaxID=1131567 RepID=A0ABQ2Y292_9BURK|nr:Nif3-like dinuclear metal center hexameric protein [Undibacterium squillarum]GGX52545.1 GTP cyclohydrolase 1 type 2 [Undibacterium squillarum]
MKEKEIHRNELIRFLDNELQVSRFRDYCPNGLQVEGKPLIRRVITGVTACQALIDAAIAHGADAIIVHHGYFWRGEDMRIAGQKYKRISSLIQNQINLLAYHLPLDAHPEIGNNAQLGQLLGLTPDGYFGDENLGWMGGWAPEKVPDIKAATTLIQRVLNRVPLVIGDPEKSPGKVAWCTGAAHSYLEQAINAGADTYISGEISEPIVHLARESGVTYIAAGHHATERYGVMALGKLLQEKFGLECEFIDIDNPV